MNFFHFFHTLRCYSKSIHPIIETISKIKQKAKRLLSNNMTFVMRIEHFSCNIDFIFHWWVWTDKKCDCSKDEAKEPTNIWKNCIDLSYCSWNRLSLGRPIEIHRDVISGWYWDWVCLKTFNIAPTFFFIIFIRKKTWISGHTPLSHVNESNCSNCLCKCHKNIFLDYIANCLLVRRGKDGINYIEFYFKIIIITQITTDETINIYCRITCIIYCLVTLHYFKREITIVWRTNIPRERISLTLINAEHFIESECIKLILKITSNIFPIITFALC